MRGYRRRLVESEAVQLSLFDERHLAEVRSPDLSFSPQRAQAPSTVVPATLFAREHALRERRSTCTSVPSVIGWRRGSGLICLCLLAIHWHLRHALARCCEKCELAIR